MAGKWAVYQNGWVDGAGRWYGYGSPPSQATRGLVSIHGTKREAKAAELAAIRRDADTFEDMRAGDGRLRPVYDVGRYDPADYFSAQAAHDYSRAEMHTALKVRLTTGAA